MSGASTKPTTRCGPRPRTSKRLAQPHAPGLSERLLHQHLGPARAQVAAADDRVAAAPSGAHHLGDGVAAAASPAPIPTPVSSSRVAKPARSGRVRIRWATFEADWSSKRTITSGRSAARAARSKPSPSPSATTSAADSIAAARAIPSAVSSARRRRERSPRRASASAAAHGALWPLQRRGRAEPPVGQVQDPVGDRRRVGLMGDDHHGPPVQTAQELEHGRAVLGVQAAGRLVGQHQLGAVDQRPGQREALLLAAGELVRKVIGDVAQPELVDQPRRAARAARRGPGQPRRQQHVLGAAALVDQLELLKDEADVAQPQARQRPSAAAGEALAGDRDLAGVGPVEAAEEMQQRRLAAARASQHRDHLVRRPPTG